MATSTQNTGSTSNRGFAAMDKTRQKEIASAGGRAAHERGQPRQAVTRFGDASEAQENDALGLDRQQVKTQQTERIGGGGAKLGFVDPAPVGGNAEMAGSDALGVVGDEFAGASEWVGLAAMAALLAWSYARVRKRALAAD